METIKTMKKIFFYCFWVEGYIIFIAFLYCISFVTCHIIAALGQTRLYFFLAMIFLGADATNAAGAGAEDDAALTGGPASSSSSSESESSTSTSCAAAAAEEGTLSSSW